MTDEAASAKREKAVRWAVASSLFSKFGTALLQLLSIPVALRVLGKEEFGIYSTVAIAISMVILLQVGLGPALTHGISRAFSKESKDDERAYYSTALGLIIGFALLAAGILSVVLLGVPIVDLFGEKYAAYESTLRSALWLGMVIILLQFVLSHTEKTREGYLETWINNLWGAGGNVLATILVGIGILFFPSVHFLILAIYGPNVLAKIGNTIHLWRQRPHLRPRLRDFRGSIVRPLLTDGLAFSLAFSMAGFVEFNAGALLLGRTEGPASVAIYNILINLDTLMIGVVLMFTTPTWPAIVDALSRRDLGWIRRTAFRLRAAGLGYGLLVGLGLTFIGPFFIPIWLGPEVFIAQSTLFAFAVYFAIAIWNHVHHTLLIGIGRVKTSAAFQVVESLIILALLFPILRTGGGLEAMLWMMAAVKASITGIAYPVLFRYGMRAHDPDKATSPANSVPAPAVTS